MGGLFITFEGNDGAGKTTQCEMLVSYLTTEGYDVLRCREPGGCKISEKLRDIILDVDNSEMTERTEALLYAAARAQVVEQVILPALEKNRIVVCERYVDSSIAYQSYARGLDKSWVENINSFAIENCMPSKTFLLFLDAQKGMQRRRENYTFDRIESANNLFKSKVDAGFLEIYNSNKERIQLIDADDEIENIHKTIVNETMKLIVKKFGGLQ